MGPTFGNYGTRNSLLALNTLAKNMADVPGRKILVYLTGGYPVNEQIMPDITTAIAMCNKYNVAIYPIDVGGLQTGIPDRIRRISAQRFDAPQKREGEKRRPQ